MLVVVTKLEIELVLTYCVWEFMPKDAGRQNFQLIQNYLFAEETCGSRISIGYLRLPSNEKHYERVEAKRGPL